MTPSLTALLTGAIVAWPLALATLVAVARRPWHATRSWLVALAPLPALAVALEGAPDTALELPWLLVWPRGMPTDGDAPCWRPRPWRGPLRGSKDALALPLMLHDRSFGALAAVHLDLVMTLVGEVFSSRG